MIFCFLSVALFKVPLVIILSIASTKCSYTSVAESKASSAPSIAVDKDTFKSFARVHPELASVVLEGNATWQQLYEIYEIYGENNSIWNNYFKTNNSLTDNIASSATTMKDFVNTFKNLDMDSVQKGITNIQKTIGLLQDLGIGNRNTYEARPIYQRFND